MPHSTTSVRSLGRPGFRARSLARFRSCAWRACLPIASQALPLGGSDLSVLLERFDEQFAAAAATDRATLFGAATEGAARHQFAGVPLVLLDVPMDSATEFDFLRALVRESPSVLMTVPFGDRAALDSVGGTRRRAGDPRNRTDRPISPHSGATCSPDGGRLNGRRQAMCGCSPRPAKGANVPRLRGGSSRRRSAASRWTTSPCCCDRRKTIWVCSSTRAGDRGIPVWFDRGVKRPHPAGRAFLAILGCAIERLSARRFAEYLSLGQVPQLDTAGTAADFVAPADDAFGQISDLAAEDMLRTLGSDP